MSIFSEERENMSRGLLSRAKRSAAPADGHEAHGHAIGKLRVEALVEQYAVVVHGDQHTPGGFIRVAAIGFFNSVINFILVVTVNQISKLVEQESLW